MQRVYQFIWMLGLSAIAMISHAEQVQIESVNYSSQQPTQVAFELSGTVHHRYRFFTLTKPSRLVVDFENARALQAINQPPADHPLFTNVRSAMRNSKDLRIVFALKADADTKGNLVKKDKGAELQLDLSLKEKPLAKQESVVKQEAAVIPAVTSRKAKTAGTVVSAAKPASVKTVKAKGRDIIVAIDAGHGGKDVGAQGSNGTQEKDVVFAIAKRLEGMVNNQHGMRAVMIRKGDYFVKLHERVKIAQAAKADLFVSIHADAFDDPNTHGASVYTLAKKGASSASARWLADSENAADGIGGGDEDKNDTLTSVLMDLSKTAAIEASQNVGSKVLKSVNAVGHLHRSAVQKAGFVVLKSPDFPSILVETAFISNPQEEQRLNSRGYQDKMASAVFGGILSHFKQYAPANTLLAQQSKTGKVRHLAAAEQVQPMANDKPIVIAKADNNATGFNKSRHVINRGETLSGIAQQYGVSMRTLRMVNNMEDGNMKVGQVLQIPRNG